LLNEAFYSSEVIIIPEVDSINPALKNALDLLWGQQLINGKSERQIDRSSYFSYEILTEISLGLSIVKKKMEGFGIFHSEEARAFIRVIIIREVMVMKIPDLGGTNTPSNVDRWNN
jgi:hypothetical protein